MPILELTKQASEEIKHSANSEISAAVREAWNDFPAHVRRKDLPDDFRITARFVDSAHDGNVSVGRFHAFMTATLAAARFLRDSTWVRMPSGGPRNKGTSAIG